jgi:hypothetical protein
MRLKPVQQEQEREQRRGAGAGARRVGQPPDQDRDVQHLKQRVDRVHDEVQAERGDAGPVGGRGEDASSRRSCPNARITLIRINISTSRWVKSSFALTEARRQVPRGAIPRLER